MAKVIVERARLGSRGPFKYGRIKNIPLDQLPTKAGMRRSQQGAGRERRDLNENLNPLRRYLRKQVGRRWDDVYRDISRYLRATSAVQQHVRDHVRTEVYQVVRPGVAGRLIGFLDIRFWGTCRGLRGGDLYVDPRSGVLKEVEQRSQKTSP